MVKMIQNAVKMSDVDQNQKYIKLMQNEVKNKLEKTNDF